MTTYHTARVEGLDVFKAAGGFARAHRFQAPLTVVDDPFGWAVSIRFKGRKGDAMFNAIRIRSAAGGIIAEITAAVLQTSEPPGAEQSKRNRAGYSGEHVNRHGADRVIDPEPFEHFQSDDRRFHLTVRDPN